MVIMFLLIAFFGSVSISLALLAAAKMREVKRQTVIAKQAVDAMSQAVRERNDMHAIVKRELEKENKAILKAKIQKLRVVMDKENVAQISQTLKSPAAKIMTEKAGAVLDKHWKRLSQELAGAVSDESEAVVRDLKFGLNEKIWDAFQQYKAHYDKQESPMVMPEGIKVAYTKGNRTILVVEQKPQLRSVSFTRELSQLNVDEPKPMRRIHDGHVYSLAFPYVYFLIIFDNDKYKVAQVYFRNKPVTSVRDEVYFAPLPNIRHEDHCNMCFGSNHHREVHAEGSLACQANMIVSGFWERTFNEHYGNGGCHLIDKRLNSYNSWQAASQDDPLFVLQLPWKHPQTLKGLIESALDRRSHKDAMDGVEGKIRELLDGGVKAITKKLKEEGEKVKSNCLLQEKDFVDNVNAEMKAVLTNHVCDVFKKCTQES